MLAIVLAPAASAQSRTTTLISGGSAAATFAGASADGTKVFFTTAEQLVPGAGNDNDSQVDVYERSGGTTKLVSTGTANTPATFAGASTDGSRVFFTTTESLLPGVDNDIAADVYERAGGTTTLLSGGNVGGATVTFAGASADGSRVFFHTIENLGGDPDGGQDVYERSGGTIQLISGGTTSATATFAGASADGTQVFFTTSEVFFFDDDDSRPDIFQRLNGIISQVSGDVRNDDTSVFGANSADGTRVFFTTSDSLPPAIDNDIAQDVYERSGGTYKVISTGQTSFDTPAFFAGASTDGARAFFTTGESMNGDDGDSGAVDVYERSGGTTMLVSGGNSNFDNAAFTGASADGTRVFFATGEKLLPAVDGDTSAVDVYERSGGTLKLVSGGSGAVDATFRGASADGTKVFFTTAEQLVPGVGNDNDSAQDVYERSNGTLKLVSPGSTEDPASFQRASADGSRVFFHTAEALVGDGDGAPDVFQSTVDPQCADGFDNDGDGRTDFPADLGCVSAADDSESPNPFVPPAQGGAVGAGASSGGSAAGSQAGTGAGTAGGKGKVINGTKRNDVLKGTPGNDVINCGAGNDRVDGGGGNDVINCGAGNDRVKGGTGNDRIGGGAGNDTLAGGAGNDSVSGGSGNDSVAGDAGVDRLAGGAGRDNLKGGPGRDSLSGGAGRDKERQ